MGEKIRTIRKEANLTQEQLAEKADLHHNFIGEVERGNMEISLSSMVKIAKALKTRVRDLVEEMKINVVITVDLPLDRISEAVAESMTGHARGKIVIRSEG